MWMAISFMGIFIVKQLSLHSTYSRSWAGRPSALSQLSLLTAPSISPLDFPSSTTDPLCSAPLPRGQDGRSGSMSVSGDYPEGEARYEPHACWQPWTPAPVLWRSRVRALHHHQQHQQGLGQGQPGEGEEWVQGEGQLQPGLGGAGHDETLKTVITARQSCRFSSILKTYIDSSRSLVST